MRSGFLRSERAGRTGGKKRVTSGMGSIRLSILPRLGLTLLALGTSCVHRPLATCLEKGGAEWREVNSPHFRISTDLGSRVARFTAVELEQLRAAFLLVLGGKVDPPGQVEV